jgi:hypothetical protein
LLVSQVNQFLIAMSDPDQIDECVAAKLEAAKVAWEESEAALARGDRAEAARLARQAGTLRREAERMDSRRVK